jgi:hypothetical protein
MRLASNSTIKKSVTTKPTTPHFRAPRMVSTISVSTVTAASLDSRERVRELLPNASSCKKGYRYPGRPLLPPVRLSLCRERLAWGVPHRATLLNAAAGRSKTRRVGNQNLSKSTARASNSSGKAKYNPRAPICIIIVDTYRRVIKSYLTRNVRSSNIRSL